MKPRTIGLGQVDIDSCPQVMGYRRFRAAVRLDGKDGCSHIKSRPWAECPSTGEWIIKMWSVRTADCNSALGGKEILALATTEMNPEDTTE